VGWRVGLVLDIRVIETCTSQNLCIVYNCILHCIIVGYNYFDFIFIIQNFASYPCL